MVFKSHDMLVASLKDRKLKNEDAVFDSQHLTSVAKLARPGMQLVISNPGVEPNIGNSKIGGQPDLPPGFSRPNRMPMEEEAERCRKNAASADSTWSWANRELREKLRSENVALASYYAKSAPLPFLAQLNFAHLNPTGEMSELPRSGMLYVFYDYMSQPWGFDPADSSGSHVVWCDTTTDTLHRTLATDQMESDILNRYVIGPRTITAHSAVFPMSSEESEFADLSLSMEQEEEYHEWCIDHQTYPDHRLLGHPSIVQGEMKSECALVSAGIYCGNGIDRSKKTSLALSAASEWRLLMQIDSDDQDGGYMWGDSGILYLWIRDSDLKARNFGNVVVILQCY